MTTLTSTGTTQGGLITINSAAGAVVTSDITTGTNTAGAGYSSEPHLHVSCFTIDATGRPKALPMSFRNLTTPNGRAAPGVPVGGTQFIAQ